MSQDLMPRWFLLADFFNPSDIDGIFSFDVNHSSGTLSSPPAMSTSPVSSGLSNCGNTSVFANASNTMTPDHTSTAGFPGAGIDYQDNGALYADQMLNTSAGLGFDQTPLNLHTGTAEGEFDYFKELARISRL